MTNQLGMFDAELANRRAEVAEEEAALQRARAARFEQRKAAILADTASWSGGEFSDRINALLKAMKDAGKEAEGMHDAILAGVNDAGRTGRLDERHVAFVEEKSRIEVARIGHLGQVHPVAWTTKTPADLAAFDVGSGQLPMAIQVAAVDRLNTLGPKLAALGFKDDFEVDARASIEARELKDLLGEVRHALMGLAPARFRQAKGYKHATGAKLDEAEDFATKVLGIDTRAHPGVGTDIQLTSSGVRSKPTPRAKGDPERSRPDVQFVHSGVYVGVVVSATEHAISQKAGRNPNELIWHATSSLAGHAPKVGELVEIVYRDGVGRATGPTQSLEVACQTR